MHFRGAIFFLFAALIGCAGPTTTTDDFEALWKLGGEPKPNDLVLTFFQVHLGDAILIETPAGKRVLIDTGFGGRIDDILNYLRFRKIDQLDGLIITHPHMDHHGATDQIFKAVKIKQFVYNGQHNESQAFIDSMNVVWDAKTPRTIPHRGDDLSPLFGQGIEARVLYPDERAISLRNDLNATSLVILLQHEQVRALLTGDAEAPEEQRLMALEPGALRADILKLGHHAAPGSGLLTFYKSVRPKIAIGQGTAGANFPPFYARPAPHIQPSLESIGAAVFMTDHVGAVQVISDGRTVRWRTIRDIPRR